jgi:hypothetical protein
MGDHIIRRGVAASGARRTEARPTAELTKQELQGLLRDHASAERAGHAELEPELELGGEPPAQLPGASSPRLLAHTLRREPTPDGMPAAARPSTGPSAPLVERDVSTIAMPRLERPASEDLDWIPRPPLASDPEHTRQLRHRETSPANADFGDEPVDRDASPASTDFEDDEPVDRDAFPASTDFEDDAPVDREAAPASTGFDDDEPVPPAADDFDAGHPVTDLALAARAEHQRLAATGAPAIPPTPRIDRDLAGTASASRQVRATLRPPAPASQLVRVLTITLALVVAAAAAYLLHSGL